MITYETTDDTSIHDIELTYQGAPALPMGEGGPVVEQDMCVDYVARINAWDGGWDVDTIMIDGVQLSREHPLQAWLRAILEADVLRSKTLIERKLSDDADCAWNKDRIDPVREYGTYF